MNEIEFANLHLGEYKTKGDEIIPTLCPFCNGGDHRDKDTFALNFEKHTFNCMRGSCGKTGHFSELLRTVGETFDEGSTKVPLPYKRPAGKAYKPSTTAVTPPTDKVTAYITSRHIRPETAAAYGVCADSGGNIAFPYYRTADDKTQGKPTFVKFRKPEKIPHGERKMWREAETQPILYGLHLCDPARKILYICEGEFDCLVIHQVSEGALNIVSVPSGADDFSWIETCAEELGAYQTIAVFGDSDAPGKKMLTDINSKLGGEKMILAPDYNAYRGCKDANEILLRHGPEVISAIIGSMKPLPITGLIDLAEVRAVDLTKIGRMITGIPGVDKATGGLLDGDLTILTGRRGEGKSSFLNQTAVESVEQGRNVCIYSGEVPADRLKYQINLCAAGRENIEGEVDLLTGRKIHRVSCKTLNVLENWYGRRIWLYDNRSVETADERDTIMRLFTQAYKIYDCKLFIIDNLMCVSQNVKAGDTLQEQANFVIKLRKFAEVFGIHLIIAAHPRKTPNVTDADEISGMGTVPNFACNVLSVHKLEEASGGYLGTGDDGKPMVVPYNAEMRILKNRAYGENGDVHLSYDPAARRFAQYGLEPKKYSWLKGFERWEDVENIPEM